MPGDPSLETLLRSLFSPAQVRHWLRWVPGGPDLLDRLPPQFPVYAFFATLVDELEREGLLAFARDVENAFDIALAGLDDRGAAIPQLFPPADQDPAASASCGSSTRERVRRQLALVGPGFDPPRLAGPISGVIVSPGDPDAGALTASAGPR